MESVLTRLRQSARDRWQNVKEQPDRYDKVGDLMGEAANEIEKLHRLWHTALRRCGHHLNNSLSLQKRNEELEAERDELQGLANHRASCIESLTAERDELKGPIFVRLGSGDVLIQSHKKGHGLGSICFYHANATHVPGEAVPDASIDADADRFPFCQIIISDSRSLEALIDICQRLFQEAEEGEKC